MMLQQMQNTFFAAHLRKTMITTVTSKSSRALMTSACGRVTWRWRDVSTTVARRTLPAASVIVTTVPYRHVPESKRGFSGGGGHTQDLGGSKFDRWRKTWRQWRDRKLSTEAYYLRLVWRFCRLVVVGYSIFAVGKLHGSIEYAWDPVGSTKQAILGSISVDENADRALLPTNSKEVMRVKRVVARLLMAAEQLLEERVASIKRSGANAELDEILEDCTAEQWETALQRLRSGEWTVLVVNNSSPNAFVTALVPRTIFVHRGLLSRGVGASDAALAFVLGHEISHTLLQHGDDSLTLKAAILGV